MSDQIHHGNPGHGDYERRDISAAVIFYFLIGLVVFLVISHFIVTGLYDFLEKYSQAHQTPISPLVNNAPVDTRKLPTDYRDYLKQNFPTPQLETDERTQLNEVRLGEEDILSTYGYVDQKAGTVRIPIERAMDLIAQRGLPVRAQGASSTAETPAASSASTAQSNKKGKKK
jgi:hypothetical protein